MKKVVLYLLPVVLVVGMAACGGGGGDDLPDECAAYCQNACTKGANCNMIPQSQIGLCAETCIDELENEDVEANDCNVASDIFAGMKCSELGELINLFGSAADLGKLAARSCVQ